MFIIDLHAKKGKFIPQPSYADVSFLLLHAHQLTPEAKHLMPVGQGKDKAYLRYLVFAAWSAHKRKKCSMSKKVATYMLSLLCVGQRIQELKHKHFTF